MDAFTKDIFIITKRDKFSKIYKLTYPSYNSPGLHVASHIMDLPYKGVTSAAISPAQDEILVKTYSKVYYYKRKSHQSIDQALQNNYQLIPYQVEAQGEGICFSNQHNGFFTLSERSFLPSAQFNFYKRK